MKEESSLTGEAKSKNRKKELWYMKAFDHVTRPNYIPALAVDFSIVMKHVPMIIQGASNCYELSTTKGSIGHCDLADIVLGVCFVLFAGAYLMYTQSHAELNSFPAGWRTSKVFAIEKEKMGIWRE